MYKHAATCTDNEVQHVRCPTDYLIRIIQALFVDDDGDTFCSTGVLDPASFHCVDQVEKDAGYYTDMLNACADKTSCDPGVLAKSAPCDDRMSRFIYLQYQCYPGK